MPYIIKARRLAIDSKSPPLDAGELNYALTSTILAAGLREELLHLCQNYLQAKGLRYASINEVIGACACAALEFRRRSPHSYYEQSLLRGVADELNTTIAAPYENTKRIENGEIIY